MSVKILIDMNLSPEWATLFMAAGWQATHWSAVGDPRALDSAIMDWARSNEYVVFTHDLDFGAILALTRATGPSVLQLRGPEVLPIRMGKAVLAAVRQHEAELTAGAILVVDESKKRVRILPI